jgi:hypothetical protein
MQNVKQVTDKLWPGIPVLPIMGVGASDGKYLRASGIPTYGVSGIFSRSMISVCMERMKGSGWWIFTTACSIIMKSSGRFQNNSTGDPSIK